MDILFLITARGGSKGIPGKNIKPLGGKPLICYSIDMARQFVPDSQICVSTDSEEIISCVENYGLKVPFKRPEDLSTDSAGSHEVVVHALDYYQTGNTIKKIVLLQPTSPFRLKKHVQACLDKYDDTCDVVFTVKKTKANPFQVLFTENKEGYLERVMKGSEATRRQDLPPVYQVNGAVYVYNASILHTKHSRDFTRIKACEMPELNSVDIDEPLDWTWAEFLLEKKLIQFDYNG